MASHIKPHKVSSKCSPNNCCVTPQTRYTVSSEGVIFFFYKLITFKLVHLYNVKHLTCTIFYSSGLQKNTRSIYGSVQHLQYLHCLQKQNIYKNRPKVFSGHLVVCWSWLLMWSVRTSHFCLSCTYTDETFVLSL